MSTPEGAGVGVETAPWTVKAYAALFVVTSVINSFFRPDGSRVPTWALLLVIPVMFVLLVVPIVHRSRPAWFIILGITILPVFFLPSTPWPRVLWAGMSLLAHLFVLLHPATRSWCGVGRA
jgi:hypothetical protein